MKRTSLQLLSFVILCSFILTGCQYKNNNEDNKQQRNYLSEVKSVNKLLLAQMTISKMATIDDIDLAKAEGMKQMAAGLMGMPSRSETARLPREIVDIYESTDAGSYQVIDIWTDSFMGKPNITTAQENSIKSKVRDNYRKDIYRKGYVERARKDAAENLTSLLKGLTGKTVIVSDPTPQGTM